MFQRLRERFARFMVGRYGMDYLGRFLVYFSLVLLVLNLLFRVSFLYWLALIVLIYGYFRMFSKNIPKRYEENRRYLELKNRFMGFIRGQRSSGSKSAQDPTKKIFKCPGCRQKVRVPKGKGTILITCPKCGAQFQKRT